MTPTEYLDQKFAGRKPRYCWMCRCQLNRATATCDHLVPKSKGGADIESNFALACKPCNNKRGNKSIPHDRHLEIKGKPRAKKRDTLQRLIHVIRKHRKEEDAQSKPTPGPSRVNE